MECMLYSCFVSLLNFVSLEIKFIAKYQLKQRVMGSIKNSKYIFRIYASGWRATETTKQLRSIDVLNVSDFQVVKRKSSPLEIRLQHTKNEQKN